MGFLGGQFGDCILEEPTVRAFLRQYPDHELILACAEKYSGVLKFYQGYSDRIVGFYAYEGYGDNWPTQRDQQFMREHNVDVVANAMSAHKNPKWPLFRHQTIECGEMFDIKVEDPQIRLPIPPNIPNNKHRIAIALFPNDGVGVKTFSLEKVDAIVQHCISRGYEVLQINGPVEPRVPSATQTDTDFYSAGVAMLGCRMLITGDTAMSWLASAFDMPVVGLYSLAYYPFCTSSTTWNPVNRNAVYLEHYLAQDIQNELIFNAIDEVLARNN